MSFRRSQESSHIGPKPALDFGVKSTGLDSRLFDDCIIENTNNPSLLLPRPIHHLPDLSDPNNTSNNNSFANYMKFFEMDQNGRASATNENSTCQDATLHATYGFLPDLAQSNFYQNHINQADPKNQSSTTNNNQTLVRGNIADFSFSPNNPDLNILALKHELEERNENEGRSKSMWEHFFELKNFP